MTLRNCSRYKRFVWSSTKFSNICLVIAIYSTSILSHCFKSRSVRNFRIKSHCSHVSVLQPTVWVRKDGSIQISCRSSIRISRWCYFGNILCTHVWPSPHVFHKYISWSSTNVIHRKDDVVISVKESRIVITCYHIFLVRIESWSHWIQVMDGWAGGSCCRGESIRSSLVCSKWCYGLGVDKVWLQHSTSSVACDWSQIGWNVRISKALALAIHANRLCES